jgi:hypothetical protein
LWEAAGSRKRQQKLVGGNIKLWEAAGIRGKYESETIFRAEYIGVAKP